MSTSSGRICPGQFSEQPSPPSCSEPEGKGARVAVTYSIALRVDGRTRVSEAGPLPEPVWVSHAHLVGIEQSRTAEAHAQSSQDAFGTRGTRSHVPAVAGPSALPA